MLKRLTKFIFGSPLQNKFALFFIVLSSVPALLLGGNALYAVDLAHRRDVSSLELRLIDQKTEEIRKFMADTAGILELKVSFPQKSEIALPEQSFLLNGILKENPVFKEASLISLSGQETAKKNRAGDLPLSDVSRLPRYTEAVNGKDYFGEVEETLEGPIMTMSAPVYNRNGDMIQIMAAKVNLTSLVRSIEGARLGSSGNLVLVDGGGRVIATKPSGALRPGENLSSLNRVKAVLSGKVLDALSPEDRYLGYQTGAPVVGAGKKVPLLGWGLLAEWPLKDADEVINIVRDQVMFLIFAAILGVLLLSPIFAARLTRPIRQLEDGAGDIEQGHFDRKVDIRTGDELEELGETFNKMAGGLKRLEELRNEFVYVVTHELRTPITVIRGYLSMIKEEGGLPDKFKDFMDALWQSSENLAKLVNDLLDVARFEAGQIKMELVAVDFDALLEEVFSEMKILAADKHVALASPRPPAPRSVMADRDRLRQVLVNFMTNAIKYNREGGSVRVEAEPKEKMLMVSVIDSGLGMSEEDLKHMFEKFYRSKVTEKIRGTGLGLFITREFIRAMGGDIMDIKSKVGEGTTITFSLPLG